MNKQQIKILVNFLSIARLLGALIFPIIFKKMGIEWAVFFVSLLFITDFIDGKLARHYQVCTKGGSMLDPLGDKLLATSCLLVFMNNNRYLLIALILDLFIALVNLIRTFLGEIVNTSFIGKVKTFILSICVIFVIIYSLKPNLLTILIGNIINLTITQGFLNICSVITIIAELIAIADYLRLSYLNKKKTKIYKNLKYKSIKEILTRLFDETKYLEDRGKPIIEILKK